MKSTMVITRVSIDNNPFFPKEPTYDCHHQRCQCEFACGSFEPVKTYLDSKLVGARGRFSSDETQREESKSSSERRGFELHHRSNRVTTAQPPKAKDRSIEILENSVDNSDCSDNDFVPELVGDTRFLESNCRYNSSEVESKDKPHAPFVMLPPRPWSYADPVCDDLIYTGIGDKGMKITVSGLEDGNYSTLHRKAWLEASDPKHRYGKNLRIYYRHWAKIGYPTINFFEWLDSTGESEGEKLPDIAECPRSQLEEDTVLYISDARETVRYTLCLSTDSATKLTKVFGMDDKPIRTGTQGWIFVLRDGKLYGSRKVTTINKHSKQRFHHSSFFGGMAVSAAGIIVTDDNGYLKEVHPHSGHYRPREPEIQRFLLYLHCKGVSLDSFQVDMQHIYRVSRHLDSVFLGESGKRDCTAKQPKKNCLCLMPASHAACFLSHKAMFVCLGIRDGMLSGGWKALNA